MSRLRTREGWKLYADRVPTALGDLWVIVDEAGALVRVEFEDGSRAPEAPEEWVDAYHDVGEVLAFVPSRVRRVAGVLKRIARGQADGSELEVAPEGTPFQRRVWTALRKIPRGKTWTYLELARRVGKPKAARAVGAANGANPVSIVIPCHRVVGTNGRLTDYSGGLECKRRLLELEGALE